MEIVAVSNHKSLIVTNNCGSCGRPKAGEELSALTVHRDRADARDFPSGLQEFGFSQSGTLV